MPPLRRRDFIKGVLAGSAVAALGSRLPAALPRRPNLVFVFPDEMRRQAVGCMGADPVITPRLDRLAAEGLVLTSACSTYPVCSPYRAMLFTGRYPCQNGVITNCYSAREAAHSYLRPDARCFSDVLHDAGYHTGYLGKWHLDRPHRPYVEPPRADGFVWDEHTPPERRHGFDFWHAYGCYDGHLRPHYWTTEAGRGEPVTVDQWSVEHETDVAIDFLQQHCRRQPDRPFALFVAHNPPHMPFQWVPERRVARYGDLTWRDLLTRPNVDRSLDGGMTKVAKESVKHYFAAVTGIDEQLGRLLDCLQQQGVAEDTIVVFTSDHGEMMGSHDRMYKSVWYEESLGVPFLIRWPGRIRPGRDDLLLGTTDIMPTLLGLLGLPSPPEVAGRDLSAALLGRPLDRPEYTPYLRVDPDRPGCGNRGLRTPTHTFVIQRRPAGQAVILHDNERDPYQVKNVAEAEPALVKHLTGQLNTWLAATGDPWGQV